MRLELFGEFQLKDDNNQVLPIPQTRGRALLAYLALKDTGTQSREFIIDLLWPDRFRKQAQASLRQVLFELRKLSETEPLITASRTQISLGPAIKHCDVWDFSEHIGSDELEDGEQALRIYRGPFLDGSPLGAEPFQLWASIQRSRLEGQLDRVVLRTTDDDSGHEDDLRALKALQSLLHYSPMCCQAMSRIMQIDVAHDRIGQAIQKYERYAKRLKLEFEERPPAELAQAVEVLKSSPVKCSRFPAPGRQSVGEQKDPWRKASHNAPVVAVLPFRYLGNNQQGDEFAMAMGEDITMMLSACRWFNVLSRSATHTFASDAPFFPKDFVNRTGADYLIYGAVVERQGEWSVNIELAVAETGLISWAKSYKAPLKNLMATTSELVPMIVAALDPAIAQSERNLMRKPVLSSTGSFAAYQHLVIGYRHFYAGDWVKAFQCFHKATEEDGTYAHAYAMMANIQYYLAQVHRTDQWRGQMREAERWAKRALEIDSSEVRACSILGQLMDWQARHDEAESYLEATASFNPSFAGASTARAYHAVMTGSFKEAITLMQTSIRLRVGDSGLGLCLPAKALAELHLGDYEKALKTAHWAMRMRPKFWLVPQTLAACFFMRGDKQSAGNLVDNLRQDYAGLSYQEISSWFPYAQSDVYSPIHETLAYFGWR